MQRATRANDGSVYAMWALCRHQRQVAANQVRADQGVEIMSLPPLPQPGLVCNLSVYYGIAVNKTVLDPLFGTDQMREYGALCRKQALEEVIDHFQRKHELCKTRHNYWQCAAIEIGELK